MVFKVAQNSFLICKAGAHLRKVLSKIPHEAVSSAVSSVCAAVFVSFMPRKAMRKISVVFDIFTFRDKFLIVCGRRENLAEPN